MNKVLIVQGAGMNMRGKAQVEIFGPATLDQINEQVQSYADAFGIEIEFFHSNIEGEVIDALYRAHEDNFDAVIINPAGYTTGTGPLLGALGQIQCPVIEVHVSNPTARGTISKVLPASKAAVYGFGVYGYYLALEGVKNITS